MKKLILSFSLIVVFAFYAFWSTSRSGNTNPVTLPTTKELNITPIASLDTSTSTVSKNQNSATNTKPVANNSSKYKDGTYTGSVVNVYHGNVEVKAVISGGKLSDIQFLQSPNDSRTSQQKSTMSMPILKSEAIVAQNAKVNIVSGATLTSDGFIKSLGTALAQAQN